MPFSSDCRIDGYYAFQRQGANFAVFLYHLKDDNNVVYQRIVKTVQSIAPYFLDFELTLNTVGNEYIRLAWRDKYSENRYGTTGLSGGIIRFITLGALFL
ncbi:MAG: hypothetical protein LBL90_12065 [Prevotellaceae bacterium]|nr:hypothetical protein [Prevotellaceae bacterium]